MMEMRREFTAQRINKIMNDPSVRPWIALAGDEKELDLTDFLRDLNNILLMTSDGLGGCIFHFRGDGCYEVHIQFLPEVRGKEALRSVQDALQWMFTRTPCMELWTKVPEKNDSARMMARMIHGVHEFDCGEFNSQRVEHWALRYNDWLRTASGIAGIGKSFHDRLEVLMKNANLMHEPHDDLAWHNRVVGATFEMILHGQALKGLVLYNRWARQAGFQEIKVISEVPLVLDIREAVLILNEGQFEALAVGST
jgi:hypothetical protein